VSANTLQRALLRRIEIAIRDDGVLILQRDGRTVKVDYNKFDREFLDRVFPIRPAYSTKELVARYRELVAWDHSFTYTTADQRQQTNPNWLFDHFPWAAVDPYIFELSAK
jgi:hypothetical protein